MGLSCDWRGWPVADGRYRNKVGANVGTRFQDKQGVTLGALKRLLRIWGALKRTHRTEHSAQRLLQARRRVCPVRVQCVVWVPSGVHWFKRLQSDGRTDSTLFHASAHLSRLNHRSLASFRAPFFFLVFGLPARLLQELEIGPGGRVNYERFLHMLQSSADLRVPPPVARKLFRR